MKSDADRDLVAAVEALGNHRSFFTSRAADMLLDGFCKQNNSSGSHGHPSQAGLLRESAKSYSYSRREEQQRKWP